MEDNLLTFAIGIALAATAVTATLWAFALSERGPWLHEIALQCIAVATTSWAIALLLDLPHALATVSTIAGAVLICSSIVERARPRVLVRLVRRHFARTSPDYTPRHTQEARP